MSFSNNGNIDSLLINKIMEKLKQKSPLTRRVRYKDFVKIIAYTRLNEKDVKGIERHLKENGMIKRSGKIIYLLE